jgi:hypothetical protein
MAAAAIEFKFSVFYEGVQDGPNFVLDPLGNQPCHLINRECFRALHSVMGQYAFLYRELLFSIAQSETKRRVALAYV